VVTKEKQNCYCLLGSLAAFSFMSKEASNRKICLFLVQQSILRNVPKEINSCLIWIASYLHYKIKHVHCTLLVWHVPHNSMIGISYSHIHVAFCWLESQEVKRFLELNFMFVPNSLVIAWCNDGVGSCHNFKWMKKLLFPLHQFCVTSFNVVNEHFIEHLLRMY